MAIGGAVRVENRVPVLTGLMLVALVALLQLVRPAALDRLGLLLFDSYQRAAPRAYEDSPVRVVDIDDESIRRLGQWPWPRTEIARLTERLGQAGASVVAFDVVFSEPDRTSPAQLAAQLERGGADRTVIGSLRRLPDNDAQHPRYSAIFWSTIAPERRLPPRPALLSPARRRARCPGSAVESNRCRC
jgi:adenylate cyclase